MTITLFYKKPDQSGSPVNFDRIETTNFYLNEDVEFLKNSGYRVYRLKPEYTIELRDPELIEL